MPEIIVPGVGVGDLQNEQVLPGGGVVDFGADYQYARPASDVAAGVWAASTGSDLYAMIDETTASDVDYIYTNAYSAATVALSTITDPAVSTGHTVRYRAKGNGLTDLVVTLLQTDTQVAQWTETNATGTLTTYSHTLTTGEAATITDYSALRLRFTATG